MICSGLSGCGGATPAAVVPPVEEAQQPIVFLYDYTTGIELARQKRMPTLVFFSVPGNVGSQRMLETTFRDEEIRQLAERLVCIHVDGSLATDLCEALGITSFPTTILYNASGVEVRRLEGRQTSQQLAVQIQMILQVMAMRPQATTGR